MKANKFHHLLQLSMANVINHCVDAAAAAVAWDGDVVFRGRSSSWWMDGLLPGLEMSRTKQQPMDTRGIWCRNKQEAENDEEAKSNKFLILRQKFHFSSKTLIILLCVNRTLSWWCFLFRQVFNWCDCLFRSFSSESWRIGYHRPFGCTTNCVSPHSTALGSFISLGIVWSMYC